MRAFGIAAGLLAAGIWGGMYVVSKVVLETIPPFTLLSLRLILGILSLGVIVALRGAPRPSPRPVFSALGVGALGFGVSVGLQFVGTDLSTAANAALITSVSPAFIFLFGIWILGEPATPRRLAALAVASLGVLLVIDPTTADLRPQVFLGNAALLGASVSWGLYSVLIKRASRGMGTTELSLLAFVGGLVVSLPLGAAERPSFAGALNLPIAAGIVYLGVVSTAIAMYLWNRSLAILEAGLVSLLFFAQPVVGVGLGTWLLGETPGVNFWGGAALIALGLLLVSLPGRRAGADRSQTQGESE
jgi:drug/metabolite transporter (DMT)-like permease